MGRLVSGGFFRRSRLDAARCYYVTSSPQLPTQFELVQLARVDNVMGEAARRARDGADEGTLVWAVEQTEGRTRRGHPWYSPPGNLYCSVILRPDFPNERCGQLAYVSALGAGSALAGLLSPMTGLRYRWPNDLLINDLRAGQILLAASGGDGDPYEWLTVGVMINVEQHPPNPEPEEFNSVRASGAAEVTVVQVLEDFAKYFLSWINRWAEDSFEPIGRQWQIRADGIGDELELRLGDQLRRGSFVKLDEQGKLVMMGSDQIERRIGVNEYFALGRE